MTLMNMMIVMDTVFQPALEYMKSYTRVSKTRAVWLTQPGD